VTSEYLSHGARSRIGANNYGFIARFWLVEFKSVSSNANKQEARLAGRGLRTTHTSHKTYNVIPNVLLGEKIDISACQLLTAASRRAIGPRPLASPKISSTSANYNLKYFSGQRVQTPNTALDRTTPIKRIETQGSPWLYRRGSTQQTAEEGYGSTKFSGSEQLASICNCEKPFDTTNEPNLGISRRGENEFGHETLRTMFTIGRPLTCGVKQQ
jgi:hypothetical protein